MKSQNIWQRLLRLSIPYRRGMIFSIFWSVVTAGTSIGLMATSAWLISKSAIASSIAELGVAVVGVRFFGVSRGVFRYLERYVSHSVTFRLLAGLRVWFYRALEPLAPARLSSYRSGDLLGRFVADVETLRDVFLRAISPPIVAALVGTTMVFFMFGFDPMLAGTLLFFMLATGVGLPLLTWNLGRASGREHIAARAELNAALIDGIQGMADTVAYGNQGAQQAQIYTLNTALSQHGERMARLDGLQNALSIVLVNFAAIAILTLAIPRVEGVFLATLTLATIASFEMILPLSQTAGYISQETQAAERLFDLVDAEPAYHEPTSASPVPADYSLQVEALTFSYPDSASPALANLSFYLPQGGKLAIVGPSGAGKSTLANLLLRFWDYEHGAIRLGGYELRDYHQDDVHRIVSVVSQRTHLFNTSIRENLRIARPDCSDADIEDAARQAQIHDFIASLPNGYDTFAGEGGAKLSGGERQRIAIARALLKDAPILILDEATANLDSLTEREFLQTVMPNIENRTLLIITHRLVMLDQMDQILVLDGGQESMRGTHDTLVQTDGLYRQLWTSQNRILAV